REVLEVFYQAPVRDMAHANSCYSSQPEEFMRQAAALFHGDEGPGLPAAAPPPAPSLRGVIAPHSTCALAVHVTPGRTTTWRRAVHSTWHFALQHESAAPVRGHD